MSCAIIQRRLLGCERPDAPTAEIASHLSHCDDCRSWQRRLLEMEQHIRLLPTPTASAGKARLLETVLAPEQNGPSLPAPAPLQLLADPARAREQARQKLSLAFALAAALLLFTVGWWALPRREPPVVPPPAVEQPADLAQVLRDRLQLRLAHARSPRERVQRLADLADEIQEQAHTHPGNADNLAVYADFYAQLVRQHLLTQARTLPEADRPTLQEIANRLRRAESEATRLATEEAGKDTASSWRTIASAAAEGDRCLRALARGVPA